MVFDFRHKNLEGKWRSSGFRKGDTRDEAFAALEAKKGPMPPGRYMSRPRDGRTKNWTPFMHPLATDDQLDSAPLSSRSEPVSTS
jgi:hypothetical protein